jgi:hypothetical protein
MRSQLGFVDIDDLLKRLCDLDDQPETFRSAVDFEALSVEIKCGAQLYGPNRRLGTVKFAKAKTRADGSTPPVDLDGVQNLLHK